MLSPPIFGRISLKVFSKSFSAVFKTIFLSPSFCCGLALCFAFLWQS
nr:MAG TPA: hypothetical protein [Caudoviricetes sp.]